MALKGGTFALFSRLVPSISRVFWVVERWASMHAWQAAAQREGARPLAPDLLVWLKSTPPVRMLKQDLEGKVEDVDVEVGLECMYGTHVWGGKGEDPRHRIRRYG